jgi:hypothetical protein
MDTRRKLAIAAGICYLITHVTSVPAAFLYGPILDRADYVLSTGADTRVLLGAFLEVICALGIIGTSVALFPIVRLHNEGGALGYVGLRTLEAGVIAVGVLPLLAVVALRQDLVGTVGADTGALVTISGALVELHTWTRLIGPGLICGTNTLLMAYLLYRSRLVPRFIPVLGLIGGPAVFTYHTAQMFGASDQFLSLAVLAVIPIFAWEVSLAIRLISRGFNVPATVSEPARLATTEALSAA